MLKFTTPLRFAAMGTLVLGFACAGFVVSASAEDATTDVKGHAGSELGGTTDGQAPVVNIRGHGASEQGGNTDGKSAVVDIRGHAGSELGGMGIGVGSGGNPTGEGALLQGNCFADMPVYNKQGKFVGRGIVNTCN